MYTILQDIRFGLRTLRKHPSFAAIGLVTLALGIGANVAIFSVVNAVLLRPLPYPNADRLVAISARSLESPEIGVSYPDYLDWQAQQTVFVEMSARLPAGGIITGASEPERVIGRLVTPSFFATLGVPPMLGRPFTEAENSPGAAPVMVISYGLWQRQFGGSNDVIGKSITYNGDPWTVVGVMPAWFDYYGRTNINNDFFTPLGRQYVYEFMRDRSSHAVLVTARLKPGVTVDQAGAELNAISARLASQYPASNTGVGATTRLFLDDYVGDARQSLRVVFTAVIFMLLIACANVANLMLARASTRRREIALRLALGASRWRIGRQLITESLLLAVAGGVLGIFIAMWGVRVLSRINPGDISRMDEVNIDARVLAFTFLITLVVGVLSGLVPALQNSKLGLNEALKKGNRTSSGGSGGRFRRSLVSLEIALSLILLVGAGLTVRSFQRLNAVEPGFDSQNILTFRMRLPDAKYKEASQTFGFCRDAMSRVSALPGVERVAVSTGFPLGRATDTAYLVEGQPEPLPGRGPSAFRQDVSEKYHEVLGIPLLRGRLFTEQDTENSPLVVIVDEELAARSFPNQPVNEVLGKRIRFTGDNDGWRQIVGVVGHVKQTGLNEQSRAQVYRPWTQISPKWKANTTRATDMIVKTSVDPNTLISSIKREIRVIDKDQPIAQLQTLDEKLSLTIAPHRFTLFLLGLFALIALLLAAIGIYGVMAYAVTQQTHEIGIRMALGAQRLDVLRLVVTQGVSLVILGIGLGLAGAFALTRLMTSLLFNVTPRDPVTFAVVTVVLTVSALLACYMPALRATKVDPLVALRDE